MFYHTKIKNFRYHLIPQWKKLQEFNIKLPGGLEWLGGT